MLDTEKAVHDAVGRMHELAQQTQDASPAEAAQLASEMADLARQLSGHIPARESEPGKMPNIHVRLAVDSLSAATKDFDKGNAAIAIAADLAQAWIGDGKALEAEKRLRACILIGVLQFYRAMPEGVIDRKGLAKAEEAALRPAKPGQKSGVMLALEAIDAAQLRSEQLQEQPRKKHGRKR